MHPETEAASDAACSVRPSQRAERLAAFDRLDVLDTPPEERYDRVTRLAETIFEVPIVTVSVLDKRRLWFKSRRGIDAQELPAAPTFCRVTVERAEPLVVENATLDPRFACADFVAGEPHIRFYAGAPLISPDGEAFGTLCVMDFRPRSFCDRQVQILVELAELVVAEMNLRQLANVDALTGALSRRAFRAEAERARQMASQTATPMSLLVFDLDRFKSVNDTYGHAVGDLVLKTSVQASMRRLRRSEVVGRLGGEEFVVLLPRADQDGALKTADTLRRAIAAETYEAAGRTFAVTASFGVSTDEDGRDIDAMLRAADAALYLAKSRGRDRCVAAGRQATGRVRAA